MSAATKLFAAALAGFALVAAAQDQPAPAQDSSTPAEGSTAPQESANPVVAPNPKDLKPRPAEMAPLAARSLLLALAKAGDHFVAVGDRGSILLSSDGSKWDQVACPVHAALTTVVFADANNGWAAGHDAAILHTADGGKTWVMQNFQPELNKPVLALFAFDAQHALAAGAYGLLLATTDGGSHWAPADAPPILQDGLHLNSLTKLGDGEIFLAGETGLVAVSKDGAAWTRLKIPYEGSLFGALPRGDKGALVYGLRGNVLWTDDVHSNKWTKVDAKTVLSFFGGARLANGDAVLVGADGEVMRVTPAGAVSSLRVAADERTLGSGTLSGVLPQDGQLIVVGELGISHVKVGESGPAPAAEAAPAATAVTAPAEPAPAPAAKAPAAKPTPAPAKAAPAKAAPAKPVVSPETSAATPTAPKAAKPRPQPKAPAAEPLPLDIATTPSAGAHMKLVRQLSLHGRPKDTDTTTGSLPTGSVILVKSSVVNPTGTWWYVTAKAGSGWVTDAELKRATS